MKFNNNYILETDQNDTRALEQEFSYDEKDELGPSRWYLLSSACGNEKKQSPIDIRLGNVMVGNIFDPVQIEGLNKLPASITAMNNGHSLVIRFTYEDDFKVQLRNGPLEDRTYVVDNIHWHWGENDFSGSEHRINGKQFSAEGHVVTYNAEYGLHSTFLRL